MRLHLGLAMLAWLYSGQPVFSETATPAPPPQSEPISFSIESVMQIIATHNVRRIEDLLPLLPEELRANYTLMRDSGSTSQSGSPESPRAILFGRDGRERLQHER